MKADEKSQHINIAVVEDDENDRKALMDLLSNMFLDIDKKYVITEFANGKSFLETYKPGLFDIAFFDIYLGDINGMEIATQIRKNDPQLNIIFLTNSIEHAVDSYSVRATYYLLKPVIKEKLLEAISTCIEEDLYGKRYIEVTANRKTRKILLKDIVYVIQVRNALEIHMAQETIRVYSSFVDFSPQLLRDARFLQCYHGCIANMDNIVKVDQENFILNNGDIIPIKTRYSKRIKDTYHDYVFSKVMISSK